MKNLSTIAFFIAIILSFYSCEKDSLGLLDEQEVILQTDHSLLQPPEGGEEIELDFTQQEGGIQLRSDRQLLYSGNFITRHKEWVSLRLRKSRMEPGYKYTAIVTPTHGNPNLFIYGYNRNRQNRWRQIRNSIIVGIDESYVVLNDLQNEEYEAYFSIYGATHAGFNVEIYKEVEPECNSSWTPHGNGAEGWHIGDFDGDGAQDIFRYLPGNTGAEMFLSTGSSFELDSSWTPHGNGEAGWHIGDFNGDGKDDIFRYLPGNTGAEMFLSTGSSFERGNSWTPHGNGEAGWHIGDFNGDGKDDIFRYLPGNTGAEMFLSTGSSFERGNSWTPHGNGEVGWHIGDFNGDGIDDIFRLLPSITGAEMFLSTGSRFLSPDEHCN